MDASKYIWSAMLTQEHTTVIVGKTVTHQHPMTNVSGLFQGSHLNWAALTKEAQAIYMAVEKLPFYLADEYSTLQSDHIPLKQLLKDTILNAKVNNCWVEFNDYNTKFKFIKGVKTCFLIFCPGWEILNWQNKTLPEKEDYGNGYAMFKQLPDKYIKLKPVPWINVSKVDATVIKEERDEDKGI